MGFCPFNYLFRGNTDKIIKKIMEFLCFRENYRTAVVLFQQRLKRFLIFFIARIYLCQFLQFFPEKICLFFPFAADYCKLLFNIIQGFDFGIDVCVSEQCLCENIFCD